MSTSIERVAVVDEAGVHLFWADEERAHELLVERKVHLVRRGGRARVLVARPDVAAPLTLRLEGRGSALGGLRTSDKRETEDNPPNVWRLRRLLLYAA